MKTSEIRAAAQTVRQGWNPNRYQNRDGGALRVCLMGSLALTSEASLTYETNEQKWQRVTDRLVNNDPHLVQALEATAEEYASKLSLVGAKKRAKFCDPNFKDPHFPSRADKAGLGVCITNLYAITNGEEAGTFLDKVAEKHEALSASGGVA